jgi:hypothetical protein
MLGGGDTKRQDRKLLRSTRENPVFAVASGGVQLKSWEKRHVRVCQWPVGTLGTATRNRAMPLRISVIVISCIGERDQSERWCFAIKLLLLQ